MPKPASAKSKKEAVEESKSSSEEIDNVIGEISESE